MAAQLALDEQHLIITENARSTIVPSPAAGTRRSYYVFKP